MTSKQTRKATVAYVEYKHSRTVPQLLCCINLRFTTIEYISMRVFIRNIAGGDSRYRLLQGLLYLASPACPSVPVTSGHL